MTTAPFTPWKGEQEKAKAGDAEITHLVTCPYYSVYHGMLDGKTELTFDKPFVNLSILAGSGTLDGQPVKKGDHLLLTADYGEARLEGKLEFIYSHV